MPESPVNAVPPRAWARGQIRFVVGIDPDEFLPALRRHLDRHGFPMVQIAQGARRHHDGDAARSRASMGALGRDLARQDHEQEAGRPAECRRLAAERHLLRGARPADDLGAAFLSRLLAACAERAFPDRARARSARHHGGALLGSRRARHASAKATDGAHFLRLARLPEGAGRFRAHPHAAARGGL